MSLRNAATGLLVPFSSTFTIFAAARAYEHIRNGIGFPHLDVKIAATHAGISVGEDGATHQCSEDIGTMRTIPGMTIISPSDAVETAAAVEAALNYAGPVYIRLGRLAVPVINDADSYKFELGKGVVFADGSDAAIFATGMMVDSALQARELLKAEGIDAQLSISYNHRLTRARGKIRREDRRHRYRRRASDYRRTRRRYMRDAF